MSPADFAYLAALVDAQGIIRSRFAGDAELPAVFIHCSNLPMLRLLAAATGTKVTVVRRDYARAGCAEHCAEKHQHVISASGRWSVTGAKATVLLHNLRPYMRLQAGTAGDAVQLGLRAPFKAATLGRMRALGWDVPDFEAAA